jgi:ABC-type branched-subunit amino acid transport system permease subunit
VYYSVVFLGVAALATGWITIHHAAFPHWFGWLAAVLGTAMIVGSAGFPQIRPLALLANIATVLFILSTSVVMWTSNPAHEPTPLPEQIANLP